MQTMVSSYWSRLKPEMDARGWGIQQMADKLGVSFQAVAKVRDGGAFGSENNLKAARLLDVTPEWLATGRGVKRLREDSRPAQPLQANALAQLASPSPFMLPVSITWEALMQTDDLPERFVVETPDDALAPNLPRGTAVVFERAGAAQPGECVLVQDNRGARYMRRYVQGVGGAFTAQALNDAYVTLESGHDGLTVLAVMAWRAERRV